MQQRPISPHLQVYRMPLLAILSITHRLTGIFLTLGMVMVVVWLVALASGPAAYDMVGVLFGSVLGQAIMFGFYCALFYHLFNGIRHMFWDFGIGLTNESADRSGIIVVLLALATAVLTVVAQLTMV